MLEAELLGDLGEAPVVATAAGGVVDVAHLGHGVGAVQAVTSADLTRVAKQYLLLDRMAVVIVGDRATIEAPIRAAGLGPVTVVPVADVMK